MTLAKRAAKRGAHRAGRVRRARPSRPRPASPRRKTRVAAKAAAHDGPPIVLYRVCKSGWAVVCEKVPSAPHTRFVCPFCPRSHRVPGPVRGFRRVRRPQWLKLRRVFE